MANLNNGDGEEDPPVLNPKSGYTERHEKVAKYLSTLVRPAEMNNRKYTAFKKKALKFFIQDGELFRRKSKNVPFRRVVNKPENQAEIIVYQHNLGGHRGVKGTYKRVTALYWWDGLYKNVKAHCNSYHECQVRNNTPNSDTLFSTAPTVLFKKVGVNVVRMPLRKNKKYIILTRENLFK